VNTQTTVGVNRLAIKPAVTIGDSIVKVFPKKVQAGKFPSPVRQNPLARSTGIARKSKSNEHGSQQKWGYVQLGQSGKSDPKNYSNNNVIIKIDHSTAERALRNLTEQTQTSDPKFFKLSDAIVKCLMSKHALLKDVRLQSANDRSAREMNSSMANSSKLDHAGILNVSSSNTTNINSSFDFKKRRNNTRKEYCKLKSKKSDVHNAIETRSSKYQKKLNGKVIIEMNESNRNDTDPDNVKSKHRIKDVTAKVAESTYEQMITENSSLRIQQESTGVTRQINDSGYRSNGGVTPALRRNDSTISENGTIYMTTPKTNIINIHGNETRDSGAINSNRRNKKTFNKNSSKSARRKHGSARQKHHDDCFSCTTATRMTTRFGIDAIGKTDATVKNVNNYMRTLNAEERNTTEASRKKQTSVRSSESTNSTKDYFLLMVKKHRKLLDYYNKYNSMKSKMPIPDNIEKHKKDTSTYSTIYNQTQRSVLFAHETFVTEPTEITKIDKIDYSSIKIENLLYESNSPNVKLTRYFTKINQTFNDIDKIITNVSRSNHKPIQRSRHRAKEDCNPNKMHKRSNLVSRKLYNENSTTMKVNNNIDSGLISSNEAVESTAADNCTYSEEAGESRETLEEESKDDFEVLLNWSKPSSTTTSSPKIVTQLNENGVKRNNRRGHNSRRRNDRRNNRSKNRRRNHNAEGKKKHTTIRWQTVETTVGYGNDYSPEPRNFSPNDPRYDKADLNQDGSIGRNNWFTTDESTTEYFKVKSSDVDESVTEHLASTSELQSEGTTNLIADGTTSPLPTTSDGRSLRKSEAWITTTTESSWFGNLWSNEEVSDEKSIDCKDLVWFLITSSPVGKEETKETRYASVSPSDVFTFTSDNEVTPVNIVSSREVASKETNEIDEERSVTYSMFKSRKSNERGMTNKLISSEKSDENSDEAYDSSWNWKTVTHSVTGGTTHDAVSDLEEEENGERASSGEESEIENGVQSVTEDYEGEHCGKDQHVCDKYTCIEEDKVCDGTADCPNANDEIDCEYIFRHEEHANGGFGELDHSSRDFEVTSSNECSFYEHPCDGGCINALSVCDGETDCLDGTDEENCTDSEGIFCAGSNVFWSRSAPRSCCTKFFAWN